jgi:hypothetical protein
MSESNIEASGMGEDVLQEYVKTYNYTSTALKFGLKQQNVVNFIVGVKMNETERWAKAVTNTEIDVVRKITGIINRVEKKMDAWENDPDMQGKYLMAIREARDNLKFYVDCLEKLYTQKQANAFRKAVLEVIRSIDSTVAQKVIEKIKEISDINKLLGD